MKTTVDNSNPGPDGPMGLGAARSRPLLLASWLVTLTAAAWLFGRLGTGALAAPPVGDLDALRLWYATRTAPEALLAGLRVVVWVLAWYLLVATLLGSAARLVRAARVVAVADALTVPAVRRLLHGALGAWLTASAVTGMVPPVAAGPPPAAAATAEPAGHDPGERGQSPPTLVPGALDVIALPIDEPGQLPGPPLPEPGPGTAAESEAGEARPEPATDASDGAAPGGDVGDEASAVAVAANAPTHTIEAGEHLWAVAEQALAGAWGRAPTDAEIVPYWVEMIERNRHRLADPANPDLVHPGLRVELPALPAP